MSRTVLSLRIHTEAYLVSESLYDSALGFMILEYVPQTIPLANHRKDSDEVHYLGNQGFSEDIGTCAEYSRVVESAENNQCIHQGVAVVRSYYDSSVSRNVFHSFDLYFSIAMSGVPVYDGFKDIIIYILVIDICSAHISLLRFLFFLLSSM
jgi:hypothetical protein